MSGVTGVVTQPYKGKSMHPLQLTIHAFMITIIIWLQVPRREVCGGHSKGSVKVS